MKTAIIYRSKTGFSARYARWLAKALHADLYRYRTVDSDLLTAYDTIIYGAGFYCGRLSGCRWFRKISEPLAQQRLFVYATGSMPCVQPRDLQKEWDMSFSRGFQKRLHLFYLPGGMNYAVLNSIDSLLMRIYQRAMLLSPFTAPDTRRLMLRLDRSVSYMEHDAIQPMVRTIGTDKSLK